MADITSISQTLPDVSSGIAKNLQTQGAWEKAAQSAGGSLSDLENQLIQELSKKAPDQGKIQSLQIMYQRAQRVYETIRELIDSMHQILMRGIQSLRVGQ